MSNVYHLSARAQAYMDYQDQIIAAGEAHHCVHGHLDCATHDNGPCVNEMFANLTPAERNEVTA